MAAITLDKRALRGADPAQATVALRLAAALIPAAALVAMWGDFARSVFIADSLQPAIETAAQDMAGAPTQERGRIAGDLSTTLGSRSDLRDVTVDVALNADRSATVSVRARIPNVFLPRLVASYGVERSATAASRLP